MTGKADAVRAVSQQFKDRTNAVIEGVMAHLQDDNAKEILGPGLSPRIGRGSLKSIVTFALYADVLRMVRDMVMADGEISDEEVQESLGLLSVLAAGFAKVRKEYAAFTQLTPENARQFLAQYESDAGLFGHANEMTSWAGIGLCRNLLAHCDDPTPLRACADSLVAWAEALAGSDGTVESERAVLESLRDLFGVTKFSTNSFMESEMAEKHVLTKQVAESFLDDPESVDLSAFTEVENAAAEVLARHRGAIELRSIESLGEEAAQALASHSPTDERFRLFDRATLDIGSYYGDVQMTPRALDLLAMYRGKLILGIDLDAKVEDEAWKPAVATFNSRQDQRLFRSFTDSMEETLACKDLTDCAANEAVFDWVFDSGNGKSALEVFSELRDLVTFCGNRCLWWGSAPSDSGGDQFLFAIGSEAEIAERLESLPDK